MLVLCSNSVTDINIDVTSNNIINKLNVIDALKLCVGGFHVIPLLGVQAGLGHCPEGQADSGDLELLS